MIRSYAYIIGGVVLFNAFFLTNFYYQFPEIEHVQAEEVELMTNTEYEAYLRSQEDYEWTEERIIEYIREVFVEDPDTAVKVAKCESGLNPTIQSHHVLSYGREQSFGLFQIHAPDWHQMSWELGFTEYKTDVEDNVRFAYWIYKKYGWKMWSCVTKNMI